ncbi:MULTISPECIES: decaprenyl-phosphate phosphoribosyltransferase [Sorangium]|uniref:decaprenyl-phosphate phosphoribosyltransferase n=1 Tax=Sorangium TaxID=39643 RepID=UPI001EEE3031|nr:MULTISPECIES: decaprenyl-phosphate phosphoribosyltransferase [Sorangium]
MTRAPGYAPAAVTASGPLFRHSAPALPAQEAPGADARPDAGALDNPAPAEQVGSPAAMSSVPAGKPPSSPPRSGVPSSRPPESGPPSGGLIAQPPILPDSPKGTLLWRVRGMVRAMRPHQWVKNLFVLAPVVFAKHLTHPSIIMSAVGAFAIFCLLAGAVYILNDIVDVEADRVHPVKRFRPIASGRVPIPVAKAMAVGLAVIALGASLLGPPLFAVVAASYYVLNVAYSFRLKKIAYLDVGCIAVFFVLRVLAGGFATKTPLSGFMIACTALLALFLGFGKRRHELACANASKQRAALDAYTPGALTAALAVTGVATIGTYLAYTLDHDTQRFFENPYLWMTTIHPLFGVIRFLQLVAGSAKAESPTQEILRDTPFVLNLVLWSAEVLVIVYRLRPS